MSENEVDRLEIAIEAQAEKASRALGNLEKRLNGVADKLSKVMMLASKGVNFNLDGGKINQEATALNRVVKVTNQLASASEKVNLAQKRASHDNGYDKKFPTISSDALRAKYKDASLGVDTSNMKWLDADKASKQYEREIDRLEQKIQEMIALNDSDELSGKNWYKAHLNLQQYYNSLDGVRERLAEIETEDRKREDVIRELTRAREEQARQEKEQSYLESASKKNASFVRTEIPTGNYNPEAQAYVDSFGKATSSAATFEGQIRSLQNQLAELGKQGYGQYDPEYDKVARELFEVKEAQREYNREMKESAKSSKDVGEVRKEIKQNNGALKQAFNNLDKMAKGYNKVNRTMQTFKKMLGLTQKQAKKGIDIGRMLNMMLIRRAIFSIISAVRSGLQEGSQNLAQYSAEYNYSLSQLVTSLLYVKNAFAVAFAPIVNVVAPYLSAFIDMVASAANTVGHFMAALTGKGYVVQAKKAWKDYGSSVAKAGNDGASGLGKAAKAAKELTNYTLGIDELNVIQPDEPDDGRGSGGSGGSGSGADTSTPDVSDMFETIEVSDKMIDLADRIKEAWANADFTSLGSDFGNKISDGLESIPWDKIRANATKIGTSLAAFLNGTYDTDMYLDIGITIGQAINTVNDLLNAFLTDHNWEEMGRSIADIINGAFSTIDWDKVGDSLSKSISALLNTIDGIIDGTDGEKIGEAFVRVFSKIEWLNMLSEILDISDKGSDLLSDIGYGIGKQITLGAMSAITGKDFSGEIDTKTGVILTLLKIKIDGFFTSINPIAKIKDAIDIIQNTVNSGGQNIVDFLTSAWEGIKIIFSPVAEWFGEKFSSAWDSIKLAFQFVGAWFSDRWNDIKNVFSNVKTWFSNAFQGAWNAVKSIWSSAGQFFKDTAKKIIDPIDKAVNGVINGINWVLDKVGSSTRLSNWTPPYFANGTDGVAHDTLGVVNDQKGATYRELVMFPNGKTIIPQGRNVMLPMPKGTKVMPANQTKALLDSTPHFAKGIGDFFGGAWAKVKDFTGDILDFIEEPAKILQIAFDKHIDTGNTFGGIKDMVGGSIKLMFDEALSFIKNIFKTFAGAGAEKAVKWALSIANDDSHGYDQGSRWGSPDYDCSSLVISAFERAGVSLRSSGANTTHNMYDAMMSNGFKDVTSSVNLNTGAGMKRGDVLLNRQNHTALHIGDGYLVQASQNEFGGITGGSPGDQTGREIATTPYYNYPWTDVLRYAKGYANGGIPKYGELFYARESGAEFVGRIGSSNAVVNNDQFLEMGSRAFASAIEGQNVETNRLLTRIIELEERLLRKETSVNIDGKRADKQLATARRNKGFSFSPA